MAENRNIYSAPEPSETPPPVDLPPVGRELSRLRRQSMRTTALLVLVMLALLGGALWLLTYQEERSILPEPATEEPARGESLFPRLPDVTELTREDEPESRPPRRRPPAAPPETAAVTRLPAAPPPLTRDRVTLTPEQSAEATRELRLAQEYLQARDLDKAERHAQRALEIWPQSQYALRMLGMIYTQRGQFDQALVILEKALEENPLSVETINSLGTAYMQKGMLDKAEELYLQTELINPDYWVAHLNLGLLNLLRGRYEAAADYLERTLIRVPDDPNPRNNLAVALLRLGRYEESRRHLHHLVEQTPAHPGPYFNMAITYVLENNFDEAMAWIQRGAQQCSPVVCQRYLADSDFNALRQHRPFQEFIRKLYPEVPTLPGN